jgi:hypothetical protein
MTDEKWLAEKLYAEVNNNFRYLMDWRHRVLVRFGVINGAVLVFARFSVVENSFDYRLESLYLCLAILLVAGVISTLFEIRNEKFIGYTLDCGEALERRMFEVVELQSDKEPDFPTFFRLYKSTIDERLTYAKSLTYLYSGTALIAGSMLILFLLCPPF